MTAGRAIAVVAAALLLAGRVASAAPPKLTVMAAASLREAMLALKPMFMQRHPGVEVAVVSAGTQELRAQLNHGATADVLAAADSVDMHALQRDGLAGPAQVIAHNELVLVVAREAASKVRQFADLPNARRVVLGTPASPIGRYSEQVLRRAEGVMGQGFAARVLARVVSREANVKQVLAKVKLGEAEAALVYRSDVRPDDGVVVVGLPAAVQVDVAYPMAVLRGTRQPQLAAAWLALALHVDGQKALHDAGLRPVVAPPRGP